MTLNLSDYGEQRSIEAEKKRTSGAEEIVRVVYSNRLLLQFPGTRTFSHDLPHMACWCGGHARNKATQQILTHLQVLRYLLQKINVAIGKITYRKNSVEEKRTCR